MPAQKVVVVTGANRGIGLAICEAVLSNPSPVKLYACSRAGKDLSFQASSGSEVTYPTLDIVQLSQIKSLASHIKSADGHVDVLINNAGLNDTNSADPDVAKQIMDTNYYGTKEMCLAFAPLMAKSGRIVNVSSTASSLDGYRKELKETFHDPKIDVSQIDGLADQYMKAQKQGQLGDWGNKNAYCASKACVNALTVALARENPGILVNCCCPGWVDTDMGNIVGKPSKTIEEGAKIPVRLGFGDVGSVSGKYWGNRGVNDTGDGEVRPW